MGKEQGAFKKLRSRMGTVPSNDRILRNDRTTNTLSYTARGLFNTFAAMIAPCSVKTLGNFRRPS